MKYYTIKDIAKKTGASETTVRRWCRDKLFPAKKASGKWWIYKKNLTFRKTGWSF